MSRLKSPRLWFSLVAVLALMIASRLLVPVPLPHIQLPAEAIPGIPPIPIPFIGDFVVTNTIIAVLLSDLILIGLAFAATRRVEMVPRGLQNVFEMVIEFWHKMSVQMIGEKLTERYLPLFLTLFLLILVVNWSELLPGYDYFGLAFQPEHHAGELAGARKVEASPVEKHTLFEFRWVGGEPGHGFGIGIRRLGEAAGAEAAAKAEPAGEGHEVGEEDQLLEGWAFVPFLRVGSSDLSFTIGLALIAFVAIQMLGFEVLGVGYLKKFLHFDFSRGIGTGIMNIFVGLLELISELARIISFAFRLFGNLFAGQTLLFVLPFLIPFLVVVPVFGLELFVGAIQGFVFAILTLAFMAVAMIGHGGHSEEQHEPSGQPPAQA